MRLKFTFAAFCLFSLHTLFAQFENTWRLLDERDLATPAFENNYKPAVFKAFHLDIAKIRAAVLAAPLGGTIAIGNSPVLISIPNAAGALEIFRVVESPVFEKGLADAYPMIKTYLGENITYPGSTARFDLSPNGFHAMILSANRKTIYVNAIDQEKNQYIVFDRDGMQSITAPFVCKTAGEANKLTNESEVINAADDGVRRTFRLCVTVNGEFSQACLNGTEPDDAAKKAKVLAVLTTNLNRANGIYDRDFGIRMNYIAGMDAVIYLNPNTDPYGTSTSSWNTSCRTTLTSIIGASNFDIGHLVGKVSSSSMNDGSAGCIGCVCRNGTTDETFKGSGYTAHVNVQGDPLVVDYWTHEMGHQFGANHTFTHQTEGTGANMEPGSGSTIMGYAGITGSTDVQLHSDDYFHAKSIDQVTAYIKSSSASCAAVTVTGNATPVANAGSNFTIPRSTPFMLSGSATDANNGDVLSYTWEQYNGYASGSNTFPTATATTGPLFRSRPYSTSPVRIFPALSSILSGANGNTWEVLPSVGRTMTFRMTVRDNSGAGGANSFVNQTVTVDGTTGPFLVTAPNTAVTWQVGTFQTVNWNVAGTTGGSVNCSNVAIELSIDGGNSFPYILLASTPNDGAQEIVVPNYLTSQARIRISAIGNIFFDISNSNFSIQPAAVSDFVFNSPDPVVACSGNSISTTLATSALAAYSTPITLSATGNPAGSTVVFSPSNTINPGESVTVSLQGTVPAGSYTLAITGISGSSTKTRNITIDVVSPVTQLALSVPTNNAINQALTPSFTWASFAGASSYILEVATDVSFTTIVATRTGLTSNTTTLASALNGFTTYYWRVKATTLCGQVTSDVYAFATGGLTCGTFASANVPVVISASGTPTITSTLTVPNTGTISSVKVIGLTVTHSYISDLTISLKSPANTSINLFQNSCSSGAIANMNINYDDAASSATVPCPPTGGITRRPRQALSAFSGQSITGTWTLTVADGFNQDGGTLDAWGLNFCITGGTLPVNWLDFTARRSGERAAQLQWSTASEQNNKEFQVERGKDGNHFEKIGVIAAGTAGSGIQHYLYNDLKPATGVNYYRLKQVDKDGKYQYSAIAKVTIDQDRTLYSLSPNPATSKAVLNVYKEMRQVNVKVMDVSGKTAYTLNKPVINAGETIELPLTQLAKGYYLVIIESGSGRFTEKLIVQ